MTDPASGGHWGRAASDDVRLFAERRTGHGRQRLPGPAGGRLRRQPRVPDPCAAHHRHPNAGGSQRQSNRHRSQRPGLRKVPQHDGGVLQLQRLLPHGLDGRRQRQSGAQVPHRGRDVRRTQVLARPLRQRRQRQVARRREEHSPPRSQRLRSVLRAHRLRQSNSFISIIV